MVLCALETYLSPHAVLCQRGAAHVVCASELQVRERGSTRQPAPTIAVYQGARAGVQSTARDQGKTPLSCFAFHDAEVMDFSRTNLQADPMRVQLGGRLTHSAPIAVEESVHLKYRVACQHVVDGARQLVGQDGQRLALAVFFLQTG